MGQLGLPIWVYKLHALFSFGDLSLATRPETSDTGESDEVLANSALRVPPAVTQVDGLPPAAVRASPALE